MICQISYFAAARSPRYFSDPLQFHPERWLPPDHPRFDPAYQDDTLAAAKPFSQGPRGCPGGSIAMAVIRLFIAKTLWHFDLEAAPGFEEMSFEKGFRWLTFWERPPPFGSDLALPKSRRWPKCRRNLAQDGRKQWGLEKKGEADP